MLGDANRARPSCRARWPCLRPTVRRPLEAARSPAGWATDVDIKRRHGAGDTAIDGALLRTQIRADAFRHLRNRHRLRSPRGPVRIDDLVGGDAVHERQKRPTVARGRWATLSKQPCTPPGRRRRLSKGNGGRPRVEHGNTAPPVDVCGPAEATALLDFHRRQCQRKTRTQPRRLHPLRHPSL